MAKDWKKQLRSKDPKERAGAIKQMALSGRAENLQILQKTAENDPDPRLREYAQKAYQHLHSSLQATSAKETVKDTTKADPARNTVQEPENEIQISQADIKEAEKKVQRAFSLHTTGQTKKAIQVFSQALALNPDLVKQVFTRSLASELTGKPPDIALQMLRTPSGLSEILDPEKAGKQTTAPSAVDEAEDETSEDVSPTTNLIQLWLSFFQMSEDYLRRVAKSASHADTFLSVMVATIATVVIFLVSGTVQIQQITTLMGDELAQLGLNLGTIFFIFLIGTVLFTPISFYLTAGTQYLGARVFGGKGSFLYHAYLLSLIQVPVTILGGAVSLLSLIPVVGLIAGLAGFGLSIFGIILTVRAVKAVHDLSTGQAIGAMIVGPIVLAIIGGCLMTVLGSAIMGMLEGLIATQGGFPQ